MSIKTTTTWQSAPIDEDLVTARTAWIQQAITDGKTTDASATPVENNPLAFERFWVDQSAANQWKTFIEALATQHNNSATVTF